MEFDRAFKLIQKEGKTNSRPYNSVIEALIWIFKDGHHISEAEHIMSYYREYRTNSRTRKIMGIDAEGLYVLAWDFDDNRRWGDYRIVSKRLNSPEAISYFTKSAISYDYYYGDQASDRYVLKYRKSNCVDTSQFIVSLLNKGGYKAHTRRVESPTGAGGHIIVCFYIEDELYLIDNGRPDAKGILGPFTKFSETGYRNP